MINGECIHKMRETNQASVLMHTFRHPVKIKEIEDICDYIVIYYPSSIIKQKS
jgi:hypothetical protein